MPVAGLGVNGRDHAVFRHLAHDAKDPVLALFDVLACDEGERVRWRLSTTPVSVVPSRTSKAA